MMYFILKTFKIVRWCIRKIIKFFSFSNPYKENWLFIKDFIDVYKMKQATGALRERQLNILNFATEVADLLEENGIQPILGYGALLGAKRHGGFIPWDDDIDFDLIREDFQKVIKLAKEKYIYVKRPQNRFWNLNKQFDFENDLMKKYPNTYIFLHAPSMLQVYKGTSLKDYAIIDLFSLDYYAENYSYDNHKIYMKHIKRKVETINNYAKEVDFLQTEIQSNPNIVKHSSKIMYGIDSDPSYTTAIQKGEWLDESDLYPLIKIKFENTEFSAPNNVEKFLKHRYGNWEELPQNMVLDNHVRDINKYLQLRYGKNNIND